MARRVGGRALMRPVIAAGAGLLLVSLAACGSSGGDTKDAAHRTAKPEITNAAKPLGSTEEVREVLPSETAMGSQWRVDTSDDDGPGRPDAITGGDAVNKCTEYAKGGCDGVGIYGAAAYLLGEESEDPRALVTFHVLAYGDVSTARAEMKDAVRQAQSDSKNLSAKVRPMTVKPLGDQSAGAAAWNGGQSPTVVREVTRVGTVITEVVLEPRSKQKETPQTMTERLAKMQVARLAKVFDGKSPDA